MAHTLTNLIDDIKEKISDKEYLDLMNQIYNVVKEQKPSKLLKDSLCCLHEYEILRAIVKEKNTYEIKNVLGDLYHKFLMCIAFCHAWRIYNKIFDDTIVCPCPMKDLGICEENMVRDVLKMLQNRVYNRSYLEIVDKKIVIHVHEACHCEYFDIEEVVDLAEAIITSVNENFSGDKPNYN